MPVIKSLASCIKGGLAVSLITEGVREGQTAYQVEDEEADVGHQVELRTVLPDLVQEVFNRDVHMMLEIGHSTGTECGRYLSFHSRDCLLVSCGRKRSQKPAVDFDRGNIV